MEKVGRQMKRSSELRTGASFGYRGGDPRKHWCRRRGVRQEGKAANWGHMAKQVTSLDKSPWLAVCHVTNMSSTCHSTKWVDGPVYAAQARCQDFSAYRESLTPWDWAGRITYEEFVGGEQKASRLKIHKAPMFRDGLEEKLERVAIKFGDTSAKCGAIGAKRRFATRWA